MDTDRLGAPASNEPVASVTARAAITSSQACIGSLDAAETDECGNGYRLAGG
ncbi:MAG: hypothetical protein ABFR95_07920 [Actinomycetota bacterium]